MDSTNEKFLKQAIEAHKAGKLQEAESLYRAILQSHPKHPDANHNLGVLVVFENKLSAGVQLFETALEADPSRGQFWVSYIDALIKAKQFSNARSALSQGKRVGLARERVEEIYSKFLLQHYQSGEYELAENLAKEIISKYPGHHFSWKVLGAICQQLGRLQESLYANQRALEISPHDPEAHSNLGTTLRDLGKLVDAESSYEKAIALKPDFAPAHNNLGTTLRDLGKLVEAEACYAKAIALKPDYAQAHSNLGTTLRDLGKLVEAEASYSKAIALNPNVAEFHNNLRYLQESIAKLAKLSINTVKNFDKSIEASNFKGWHKDDSIQYWPTKKITNNFDDACRELFKSQAPKFPIFSQNASIGTMGSCFAMRIREWMKYQNKKSDTIFIPEGLNNSFAVKQYLEWVFTGDRSYGAYAYDQNDTQGIFKWESQEEQEATKEKFLEFDGYIITYGLSEVWRDKETKGVFWRGVPQDVFDPAKHECVSSNVEENTYNIKETIKLFVKYAQGRPLIITLSPVPLNATYLNQSCVMSDCVSKSTLRIAIDLAIRNFDNVYYWPSFEFAKWLPAHSEVKTFGGQGEASTLDSRHVSEWAVNKIIEEFSFYFFKK